MAFSVDVERHEPQALFLCGQLAKADAPQLERLATAVLEGASNGLVLDLTAVTSLTPALIGTINALSAVAGTRKAPFTIRIPEGELADELLQQPIDQGVLIERTRSLPVAGGASNGLRTSGTTGRRLERAADSGPATDLRAPGSPRRTGHGHITSYGQERRCVAPGCGALLSRYNAREVCALHA